VVDAEGIGSDCDGERVPRVSEAEGEIEEDTVLVSEVDQVREVD
jgi:hypothetical protein